MRKVVITALLSSVVLAGCTSKQVTNESQTVKQDVDIYALSLWEPNPTDIYASYTRFKVPSTAISLATYDQREMDYPVITIDDGAKETLGLHDATYDVKNTFHEAMTIQLQKQGFVINQDEDLVSGAFLFTINKYNLNVDHKNNVNAKIEVNVRVRTGDTEFTKNYTATTGFKSEYDVNQDELEFLMLRASRKLFESIAKDKEMQQFMEAHVVTS